MTDGGGSEEGEERKRRRDRDRSELIDRELRHQRSEGGIEAATNRGWDSSGGSVLM